MHHHPARRGAPLPAIISSGLDDQNAKAFRGKDWAILESEKLGAFGERLYFAEQKSPEGFGHAVFQAKKFVGGEPFLLLLGRSHLHFRHPRTAAPANSSRCMSSTCSTPSPACSRPLERLLHLFGVIRGEPIEPAKGIYKSELIIEKPSIETARQKL